MLHEQSERYRRLSIRRETGMIRDVEAEHAAIVHAVLRRDVETAVSALSVHFHNHLASGRARHAQNFRGRRNRLNRTS